MKKFLLSIFAVMLAVFSVQAEEVTFDFTSPSTLSPSFSMPESGSGIDINGAVFTESVVNFTATDGTTNTRFWNSSGACDFRVYKNAVITISVPEGYIITGVSSTGTTINWGVGGNSNSVQYTATGTLKIKKVTVTYEANAGEGGGETPEQPEEPVVPEDGIVWNLVEDVNDIKVGDEVIIAATTQDVALGALSGSIHTSTPVTVSDNTLTDTGDAIVLTVGKNGDNYTFSYDSKYLNWTSSNTLTTATAISENTSWTIAITDGVATISNVGNSGRMLQYNASSPRFACYLATSNQQNVRIYKKTELLYSTLTVSDAGWATLYLGATARIPSTVEAYIIKKDGINNGYITLTQVTGVLPANTGIIVKAAAEDYKFFMGETATADVTGNLLEGTLYNQEFDEEAYVLGQIDGVVGLYLAEMTDGTWLNNANKAYLPVSALTPAQQTAAFYGFDWDGTTGVEKVEIRNEKSEIYDLTGRRVEEITAPGIYVVNGKKVLVK